MRALRVNKPISLDDDLRLLVDCIDRSASNQQVKQDARTKYVDVKKESLCTEGCQCTNCENQILPTQEREGLVLAPEET